MLFPSSLPANNTTVMCHNHKRRGRLPINPHSGRGGSDSANDVDAGKKIGPILKPFSIANDAQKTLRQIAMCVLRRGVARGDPLCFLITVLAFVIIIIGRSSARPDRFDRF